MQNEHIEHFINQSLLQDSDLSASKIAVESNSGVVTLHGSVQSFSRKLKAAETVRQCEGVKHVINDLKVVPAEHDSDLKIADEINEALTEKLGLNEKAIRVDVQQGGVTLTGYASSLTAKQTAEDITVGVNGVRSVKSLLVVNRDRVLANEELSISICAAINRIIGMENDVVGVSIVDEMARLSGTVDSGWKYEAVEETVRRFGIVKVCNDIVLADN